MVTRNGYLPFCAIQTDIIPVSLESITCFDEIAAIYSFYTRVLWENVRKDPSPRTLASILTWRGFERGPNSLTSISRTHNILSDTLYTHILFDPSTACLSGSCSHSLCHVHLDSKHTSLFLSLWSPLCSFVSCCRIDLIRFINTD